MKEIWKPVKGYEGCYEVSNIGRVRSLPRTREVKNRFGGTNLRTDKGCVMSPNSNGNGYLYVPLSDDGFRMNHYIHRLVAMAFCDGYKEGLVVDHLDGNRQNNNSDNLKWVTQKQNVLRSASAMRKPKSVSRPTNTGIKYICRTKNKGREIYRVCHRQKRINRQFKTLDEAIAFLEGVVG